MSSLWLEAQLLQSDFGTQYSLQHSVKKFPLENQMFFFVESQSSVPCW